jgi:hypothetical protein
VGKKRKKHNRPGAAAVNLRHFQIMSIADNWEYGELYKELAELKVENALLRQDKKRLDWLLSSESNTNIEVGRYGRGEEYKPWVVDTLHNRADIDEAMGGTV